MKSKLTCSVFAVTALLTLPATAQGPAGGTGAIASIPGSVYRAADDVRPVTQPGILSFIANPPPPIPNLDSKQTARRPSPSPMPPK